MDRPAGLRSVALLAPLALALALAAPARADFGDAFDLAVFWQCGATTGYLTDTGSGPAPCLGNVYDGTFSVCGTNVFTAADTTVTETETDHGNGSVTITVTVGSADGSDMLPGGLDCPDETPITVVGCDLAKQDAGGAGVPGDPLDPDLGDTFEILEADAVIFGSGGSTLLEFDLASEGSTAAELKDRFTVGGVDQVPVTALQFRYTVAVGEPRGACCLPGECEDGVTLLECLALSGTYAGDFTTCAAAGCGPPANDDCATAATIADGSTPYDTSEATLDPLVPACDPDLQNDLWYFFEASCDGTLSVDTCDGGGGPDTVLELFGGASCGSMSSAGCADDSGCGLGGLASLLELPATAGEPFFVRVGQAGAARASGTLRVTCQPAIAGGACCQGPFGCVDVPDQAACAGLGGSYDGDGSFCGVTYEVPAEATTTVLDTCGSSYDTELRAFTQCGGAPLGANDDCRAACPGAQSDGASCLCLSTTPGAHYWVRVSGFGDTPPPPGSSTSLFVQHGDGDGDDDDVLNRCDNCPAVPNPGQTDDDVDFEGDVCDPDDGRITLYFDGGTHLDWAAELGFATWNVYRGELATLRATGLYTQPPGNPPAAERTCGLAQPGHDDGDAPAAGEVLFYLGTGVTAALVESDLGVTSGGSRRPNDHPCP